jgi:hypothetical protein
VVVVRGGGGLIKNHFGHNQPASVIHLRLSCVYFFLTDEVLIVRGETHQQQKVTSSSTVFCGELEEEVG